MNTKTLIVVFLVCLLVSEVVLARRCGGGRKIKIKKIVRKLRPIVRVMKVITRMRTRRPRPRPCNSS
uniref:Venom protein 27.1 n=1 Tax=Lychas mucronatus TaxID=172552 RepID=VP271_LYCMC|nr:RecName: Full=Venom protein 27.1; Flags: Precursor [Lychas mucronatus]